MPAAPPDLRDVKTFPALVDYLRDELDWPVEEEAFEDLTFAYEPEELGLKPEFAAKVEAIKQLRPLTTDQPWGIFFVEFEPRKLPVGALRKILGGLAKKKRGTSGERAAWQLHDLLFISACGAEADRQITFAHFSDRATDRLPVLEVLGWEEGDRALKRDHVRRELETNLRWPEPDERDADAWRARWSAAFTVRHGEVIRTSKRLAERLAELARVIREEVKRGLRVEDEHGPLTRLWQAFRTSLIQDLDEQHFAGMYAQTIAYGLLAAKVSRPAGLTADDPAHMARLTSPFLGEMLDTFLKAGGRRRGGVELDFDELGVNDVVDTLERANMPAVLRDFDHKNPQKDPVIHFYELFAKEFDPAEKIKRGEFYTPKPVVSYIVRSVHELLQTEFGLSDGLADTATWADMAAKHEGLKIPDGTDPASPFVKILDPATGTGTFLVEAIDVIHRTLEAKWEAEGMRPAARRTAWNEYVPKHLLPRLYGYELKMAPYAVAHMKLGLKLAETGYDFDPGDDVRVNVYLANALEPGRDRDFQKLIGNAALAREAAAVSKVKRAIRFTAVIGNPPYSGISANKNDWIDGLLKGMLPGGDSVPSYYHVNDEPLGERKLWLQDDYVKFLRLTQHYAERAGVGVAGVITNHGYLDNPTFRGLRWSQRDIYTDIRLLDLHGNVKKREAVPGGGKDANVFDIQQGVAVGLFVKAPDGTGPAPVRHAELWGDRKSKYDRTADGSASATDWKTLEPVTPFYLFAPFVREDDGNYDEWRSLNDVLPVNVTGIVTARDGFVIDTDAGMLLERISALRDTAESDAEIRQRYFAGKGSSKYPAGDSRGWKLPAARDMIRADDQWQSRIKPILYRPFDTRSAYYVPWMIDWPRAEAMPHLVAGSNLAIATTRQTKDEWSAFVTRSLMAHKGCSRFDIGSVFPLYLYPGLGKVDSDLFHRWPAGENGRRPNLDPVFAADLEAATGLVFAPDGPGDLASDFGPEDVLAYLYGVLHAPTYRTRFEPLLKLDFPRVPPPGGAGVFRDLAALGRDLLALHLLESPLLATPLVTYAGPPDPVVEKASYEPDDGGGTGTVWLDKAKTAGFPGVPADVWEFHVGGYQVCHKWLKDRQAKGGKNPRPGRTLAADDLRHYGKVVTALHHTIRLMGEIDAVIDRHGGWPGAFVTERGEDAADGGGDE